VEGWGGPWDFHLFHYIPTHYPHFYIIAFLTIILSLYLALRRRTFQDIYIALWIFGVILPFSLFSTKVYNYTAQIMPAVFIGFSSAFIGCLTSSKKKEYQIITLAYASAMMTLMLFSGDYLASLQLDSIKQWISQSGVLRVVVPTLASDINIGYQVFWLVGLFLLLFIPYITLRLAHRIRWQAKFVSYLALFLLLPLSVSVYSQVHQSVQVTQRDGGDPSPYADRGKLKDVGNYAKEQLEQNAVLFLESTGWLDNLFLMFYADRNAYRIGTAYPDDIVRYFRFSTGQSFSSSINIVEQKGGIPYLVSTDTYRFPLAYESPVAPYYNIYKLSSSTFSEEAPKRSELLLYLPFDEGNGSITKERSGNGNHGIPDYIGIFNIHGATWVKGKFGNALAFDGKDDYVEIPHHKSLNVADGITIAAWVKGNDFSGQKTIINASETRDGPYLLQINNGIAEMGLELSPGWNRIQSAIRLTEGQFCHLAATYEYDWDGGSMKMYLNGQLQETSPLDGTPQGLVNSLTQPFLSIGQRQGSDFVDVPVTDQIKQRYQNRHRILTCSIQLSRLDKMAKCRVRYL
jgi:hypothetical protein